MLIVIVSLSMDTGREGVFAVNISREHNIPEPYICGAVKKLFQEKLLTSTAEGRLFLSPKISSLTLGDLVLRFGDTEFSGTFKDVKTKEPLKLSMASRVIFHEQAFFYDIVRNRIE
ncbi:MAG: hypothetical protein RR329_08120, partial [Mucinivorans sp.]